MSSICRSLTLQLSSVVSGLLLNGCASMTPTTETHASYVIYDVKPAAGVGPGTLDDAIKGALQKNMSGVQISTAIPPSPLPDKPGKFKLVKPNMPGLTALTGQSFEYPACDGAVLTATAQGSGMSQYGEHTSFFLCLLPYQGGYNIDIYNTFTKTSGGVSTEALGAALARSVVGDSSQFLPKTIQAVVKAVADAGATTTQLEQYP